MRVLVYSLGVILILQAGCFSRGSADVTEQTQQVPPAEQALKDLQTLRTSLTSLSLVHRTKLHKAGARIAVDDPTTRIAASLVRDLRRSLRTHEAMQLSPQIAATAPSLHARVKRLRRALDEHHRLLVDLKISPLPPAPLEPTPDIDADPMLDAQMIEAVVFVEETMQGQWPLKHIFIAYSLELESIRDEAAALSECTDACPEGVARQATALYEEAARLTALLEEFAALYC